MKLFPRPLERGTCEGGASPIGDEDYADQTYNRTAFSWLLWN